MNPRLDFVHEFVPGTSKRTLLLLHGTGGNEHDLVPLGRQIDSTAAILSPRGKVLENGMPRFFRRLAEGIFDEEDLKRRTHQLADFVDAAAEQYEFAAEGSYRGSLLHLVSGHYSTSALNSRRSELNPLKGNDRR